MAIIHQWVKFSSDVIFPSTDYCAGEWVLAEVETDCAGMAITLFGVEYMMSKEQVSEWEPIVAGPDAALAAASALNALSAESPTARRLQDLRDALTPEAVDMLRDMLDITLS